MNYRRLLKGAVEWAVRLVDFAVLNGVRLNDASPCNTGFEPVAGKWKVIDAACYKIAGAGQGITIESSWQTLRHASYRFKGHYVCTLNFMNLLDSVMAVYVATSRADVLDEDVECVIRRRAPDAHSGHRKVDLLAARAGFAARRSRRR